jgi:hypothetical protein
MSQALSESMFELAAAADAAHAQKDLQLEVEG